MKAKKIQPKEETYSTHSRALCFSFPFPDSLCEIDDELKAIYHGKDSLCIWVFPNREIRLQFQNETVGMNKSERESHFQK